MVGNISDMPASRAIGCGVNDPICVRSRRESDLSCHLSLIHIRSVIHQRLRENWRRLGDWSCDMLSRALALGLRIRDSCLSILRVGDRVVWSRRRKLRRPKSGEAWLCVISWCWRNVKAIAVACRHSRVRSDESRSGRLVFVFGVESVERNVGHWIQFRCSDGEFIECRIEHVTACARIPFQPSMSGGMVNVTFANHDPNIFRAVPNHLRIKSHGFAFAIAGLGQNHFGWRLPVRGKFIGHGAQCSHPPVDFV